MILANVRIGGGTRAARRVDDEWELLDAPDVVAALVQGVRAEGGGVPRKGARDLLPPTLRPATVVCAGHNYGGGPGGRDDLVLFLKSPQALVGPDEEVRLPAVSDRVDGEPELAVVLKAPLDRAGLDEAKAAIGGYTVFNDVTARDFVGGGNLIGKTFFRSSPIGPYLVTPDVLDPADGLAMSYSVNGEVVCRGNTAELVRGCGELAALVSRILPLQPGDVITTGSPELAPGSLRRYLRPGDVIETRIEGIGCLRNVCVAAGDG